jgi:hypothetical protein
MRIRTSPMRACAIIVGLTGMLASPAVADDETCAFSQSCSYEHSPVGCLTIGQTRYDIVDAHDVRDQLVYAFRQAGYDAYVRGSSVYVQIGYRAPIVRFSGLKHRVSVSRRGDCLVLRPYRVSTHRTRPLRYSRPYYGYGSPVYGRRIGYSNVVTFRSTQRRCR